MSFKYHLNSIYLVLYTILPYVLGWSSVNFVAVHIHFVPNIFCLEEGGSCTSSLDYCVCIG